MSITIAAQLRPATPCSQYAEIEDLIFHGVSVEEVEWVHGVRAVPRPHRPDAFWDAVDRDTQAPSACKLHKRRRELSQGRTRKKAGAAAVQARLKDVPRRSCACSSVVVAEFLLSASAGCKDIDKQAYDHDWPEDDEGQDFSDQCEHESESDHATYVPCFCGTKPKTSGFAC